MTWSNQMIIIFTQECEAKMRELERHLQIGLQRFLELKKVLDSFQEEIEYSDDSINGFIQVKDKIIMVNNIYNFVENPCSIQEI